MMTDDTSAPASRKAKLTELQKWQIAATLAGPGAARLIDIDSPENAERRRKIGKLLTAMKQVVDDLKV